LGAGKLQAITENSVSSKTFENGNSALELTEQNFSIEKLENLDPNTLSSNGNSASELTEQNFSADKLENVEPNTLSSNGNSASELTEQNPSADKLENPGPDTLSSNGNSASELTEQNPSADKLENLDPNTLSSSGNSASELTEQNPSADKLENPEPDTASSFENSSIKLHFPSKPPPQLMAVPENFNPGLRLPPPKPRPLPPPSQPPASEPPTSTEPVTPAFKLESLTTDFRWDEDSSDKRNLFSEQTAQFRLRNGNRFRIKTGFNSFEQREVESVTNIPLQVEWQGKIDRVTLTVGGGVDVFDRLPAALNFNAKVEAPFAMKASSSGRLQSGVVVSVEVERGPYKSNVETLENQIAAWRFGPSIYWQIDQNTSLYSSLRLGTYNDGNFEQQSFSRLERKFGQFSVAANLFNWHFARDAQETGGYFSPPDFLVYSGEVAWEGNVFENLRCRLAASLGQQRVRGEVDNANTYQARCTAKFSPNIEADFGYAYSNVRNQDAGGSSSNSQSFTGQLRVRF
jgi:hypothetical protein